MLIASDILRKKVIATLQGGSFWKAMSVPPPGTDSRFLLIESISENEVNEKNRKLTQGSLLIQVTERFVGNAGTMANVDAQTRLVVNALQPTAGSIIGNYQTIRIFSTNVESASGQLFETPNGRTALRTIRLMYRAEAI